MDDPAKSFMEVTGASREQATRHLSQANGDLEQAIMSFLEAGEQEADGDDDPAVGASAAAAAQASDSVAGILEAAGSRKAPGADAESGQGEDDKKPGRTILVLFFSDGFTAQELTEEERAALEKQDKEDEPEAKSTAAPAAPRRTGMMTLNDFQKPATGRGAMPKIPKMPKLPPMRAYGTPDNEAFLALIKQGRLPRELQSNKVGEDGKPITTSIAVQDLQPSSYQEFSDMIQKMEKMRQQMEAMEAKEKVSQPAKTGPALFAGAGHSLSSTTSGGASASGSAGASGSGGPGADAALIAIVGSGAKPTVDESKPTTTIQIRLGSGARVKAQLNLDHTVADIWRLVAAEMGVPAFAAASNHGLSAGFPPKPLTDSSITLADADLKNASVTHRCS